jgi:selenocysteine lyase/cysteine desulfurase
LDNAATTPAAVAVVQAVVAAAGIYGSVHRGSGLKSVLCTALYERTLARLRRFVGASEAEVVAVAANSTTAINRFAQSYGFEREDLVLISELEHSSNDLPWRKHATVRRIASLPNGAMDLEDLERTLRRHGRKVRLVAVAAASNVNGYLAPLPEIARLAHRYGAEVFVDAAQLAAHRPLHLRTARPELDLDYVAFSGHKMYAPFGVGVVIGHPHAFAQLPPDAPGGGTIEMLSLDSQIWAPLPGRANPGSPNLLGLIATAAAADLLQSLGFDAIRAHEQRLVRQGLEVLGTIPEVVLHGQAMFAPAEDRLPIFPFTMRGIPFARLAAMLGHEYGIAVRQGHLCQYEFMRRELCILPHEQARIEADLRNGDKSSRFGMVRASCGACTSAADLAALGEALQAIGRGQVSLEYRLDRSTGEYVPVGQPPLDPQWAPPELQFLFR